jgi:hypothetical protein
MLAQRRRSRTRHVSVYRGEPQPLAVHDEGIDDENELERLN